MNRELVVRRRLRWAQFRKKLGAQGAKRFAGCDGGPDESSEESSKEGERRPVENVSILQGASVALQAQYPGRKRMNKFLLATTSICGLLFVQGVPARADADLDARAKDPKQWVMQQGDDANTRYSKLNQINAANVGKLQVAWTFSTGVLRGHEGGPLIVGNTMYVHTPFPNTVYALDLSNENKIAWKYEPKQDPNVIPVMCCDTVNRGVAYGEGKIFLHQADTTLVALDAKTGKVEWTAKNGDPGQGATGTSAPMVVKDKVLIGISGGEFGVQAHMTAYDIKTGKQVWRAYSEGPDAQILVDPAKTAEHGKPG